MLLTETLAVLMVVAVIVALMAGYPVALTLAGVSLAFAVLGHALGVMHHAVRGHLVVIGGAILCYVEIWQLIAIFLMPTN